MHNGTPSRQEKLELLHEAISRRRNVEARYNGVLLHLSPHQIFIRNEAFYLAAFNGGKSRRHDEEPKLGGYHLAGLSQLAMTGQDFEPLSAFDRSGMRPGDQVLVTVESGPSER